MCEEHTDLPKEAELHQLSDLFQLFSDFTRIRIMYLLTEAELRVGDIAKQLSISLSSVSTHLKTLKNARLVKMRREGKEIFYTLDDDHVRQLLTIGMEHLREK